MDVLTLLNSKNRCLERYLELSLEFLRESDNGNLDGLAMFETRRNSTLKALELYDRKITEVVTGLSGVQRTPALVAAVRGELARKDKLVHRILEVDLKIISRIEEAKNNLLKELASSRKNKEMVGKFKSTWVSESGEELDAKL